MTTYVTKVMSSNSTQHQNQLQEVEIHDHDNGSATVTFSDEFVDRLGWQEEDLINLIVDENTKTLRVVNISQEARRKIA